MLKYRGSSLIRAGFIGVVLIILVIAVGLQPERLMSLGDLAALSGAVHRGRRPRRRQRRDGVRNQGRLGLVVRLDNGDALVGFTIDGKYALGSDTTAHIRTGTLLGERVLALESAGSGTLRPDRGHPDVADVVAVFADRGGQRAHRQHRGHRHRHRSTSRWTRLAADARSGRSAAGADVRRPVAAVAVAQQPQRQLWPSC